LHQKTIPTGYESTQETTVAPGRRLCNWIDAFIEYSSAIQSPEIFRRWAAIGIVSAMMERRVWCHTRGSTLYPNTYIVLTALPGVGKSEVLKKAEHLLRQVPRINITPSSVTTASLVDTLADAAARDIGGPAVVQAVASELGVFLPAYDPSYINTLTKLYDGEFYEERRRGNQHHLIIERPLLGILGGTTPSYLSSFLPEGAWDQGLTSRTCFIYSNEVKNDAIFGDPEAEARVGQSEADLVADLHAMTESAGQFTWTRDAQEAITWWRDDGMNPGPEHKRLANYASRRVAHLLKLCMIMSMSHSNDLIVTWKHFIAAKRWMLKAEEAMAEIFGCAGRNADGMAIDDTLFFIRNMYYRGHRKPVGLGLILSYLKDRVPVHSVEKCLQLLENSGQIVREWPCGLPAFRPDP
jgi:hypothetical protein